MAFSTKLWPKFTTKTMSSSKTFHINFIQSLKFIQDSMEAVIRFVKWLSLRTFHTRNLNGHYNGQQFFLWWKTLPLLGSAALKSSTYYWRITSCTPVRALTVRLYSCELFVRASFFLPKTSRFYPIRQFCWSDAFRLRNTKKRCINGENRRVAKVQNQ